MNDNFTSLVFFTVLCQTAAGALIFRGLTLVWEGSDILPHETSRYTLPAILILLAISLGIAFFHLGKPVHAVNALNNIRQSWLSREIFSLSVLIALIFIFSLIITSIHSQKIELIFFLISVAAIFSLIYSMIRLYMIQGIISWNNPFTPVEFISSTLVCGLSFFLMLISGKNQIFNSSLVILIVIFIITSLINSIFFSWAISHHNLRLFVLRSVLSLFSLTVAALIYFSPRLNKIPALWVVMFIMIICTEIVNRFIFFLSFEKSGL